MEVDIHADAPLQYASIQILPTKNRYEAYICGDNKVEKLSTGILDHLLPYIPSLKDFCSRGTNSNFKLQLPENLRGSRWFTKSTLSRFLDIVNSPDLINETKAFMDEMSQLEEARKFHVSIYSQGHQDQSGRERADGHNSIHMVSSSKPEVDLETSDSTRNELLRAMDSRLAALKGEFASAFCRASSRAYSNGEISSIAMFSRHFGTAEMENALHEILKPSPNYRNTDSFSETMPAVIHNPKNLNGVHSEIPVQYSVSPAKVAEVERHSSTGTDDSSDSGGEGQTSADRSRTVTRSTSRRRSASPMRRVQIGRSGARKPAVLTIRSLGYFPGRDKAFGQEEISSNGPNEEGFEQSGKKPEIDIKRMSVQDRIKIFESKQRDQDSEIEKRRSLASISANKSVLRRWSAGMGESSTRPEEESDQIDPEESAPVKQDHVPDEVPVAGEMPKSLSEVTAETNLMSGDSNTESDEDVVSEESGNKVSPQMDDAVVVEGKSGRLMDSAEWSRQKEAELNQMLMKMMETSSLGTYKKHSDKTAEQDLTLEQRGGFYDQYKQKRDEKLQGENAGKRAQKQAQFRAMQEILNVRKAEMASANVSDAMKKQPMKKIQRSTKTPTTQTSKPRKEASSPAAAASATSRKTTSRTSPLPPTRKSWPSTPPALRTTGTPPAKTPTTGPSSAGTTPTRRKPQSAGPPPSVSRPKPKVEKPQVQKRSVVKEERNVKETPIKNERSIKAWDNSKKVQPVSRTGNKVVKPKTVSHSGDVSADVPAKPSFYNKVTKKSSVVPLESKPLRKSTGTGPSVKKKKNQPEEAIDNELDLSESQKIEQISTVVSPDNVGPQELGDDTSESVPDVTIETETQENSHFKCGEAEVSVHVAAEIENGLKSSILETVDVQAEEEPTISPMTWVEIEEHQEGLPNPCDDDPHASEIILSSNIVPIGSSSPRVRHSLSQMLQEESSEADITEWGNAENPPSIIFQKDAPKGFKRLLKFARKSKGDGNASSGWSSPSVYSEGEDDGEDLKVSSKRSTDNLLRALHAKNFGHQKFESYEKHLDVYEQISANSGSQKFQDGRASTAAPATKATRSFFSLSAFRGSKPNDTKFR